MSRIDQPIKGLAPGVDVGALRASLVDGPSLFGGAFTPPVMTLRRSALEHNVATMARYCRDRGVDLAPHGKTTMAARIFERQLAAGAWAMTVATPAQVAFCRSIGVPRVLLANELLDEVTIAWLARELESDRGFEFLCYVDSTEGVARLARGAAGRERPFDVLVEVGFAGGRTGCRTVEQALEVARAAETVPGVRVVGVAGFEGGIGTELTPPVLAAVDEFLGFLHATASELVAAGVVAGPDGRAILSAGGSVFFDRAAEILTRPLPGGAPSRCVLRSGCYATHDSGFYERMSPFGRRAALPGYTLLPALEVWAEILSTPEPRLALAGIGRRDVPFDLGLPVPLRLRPARGGERTLPGAAGSRVDALNDQHAFVALAPGVEARPGDWMSFGISHPCTAMDKWRVLAEVDDEDRVVGLIDTTF